MLNVGGEKKMSKLSLNVPKALEVKIRAEAKRKRATRAKVALEALEKQFFVPKSKNGRKFLTIYDVAPELVGCVEGPGDLSYNKKRMEGYGR